MAPLYIIYAYMYGPKIMVLRIFLKTLREKEQQQQQHQQQQHDQTTCDST